MKVFGLKIVVKNRKPSTITDTSFLFTSKKVRKFFEYRNNQHAKFTSDIEIIVISLP